MVAPGLSLTCCVCVATSDYVRSVQCLSYNNHLVRPLLSLSPIFSSWVDSDGPFSPFPCSSTPFLQGTGNVGADLASRLVDYGATVYTSDIVSDRANITGCTNISGTDWKALDVDIFSPNGPAGIIDAQAVAQMSCKAIVGAANVPFETEADREAASAKGGEKITRQREQGREKGRRREEVRID